LAVRLGEKRRATLAESVKLAALEIGWELALHESRRDLDHAAQVVLVVLVGVALDADHHRSELIGKVHGDHLLGLRRLAHGASIFFQSRFACSRALARISARSPPVSAPSFTTTFPPTTTCRARAFPSSPAGSSTTRSAIEPATTGEKRPPK